MNTPKQQIKSQAQIENNKVSRSLKPKGDNYIDSTGVVHNKELLSSVINRHDTSINNLNNLPNNQHQNGEITIQSGETGTFAISGAQTGLLSIDGHGSNFECAILYLLQRKNQYYGGAVMISSMGYQNAVSKLEITISSTSGATVFSIKNNHSGYARLTWNFMKLIA